MKKWSVIRITQLLFWGFSILGLLVLMANVASEEDNLKCREIDIKILPELETHFADHDDVVKMMVGEGNMASMIGRPMNTMNVSTIERNLELSPYVKNAEVFADIDGALRVEVSQKKPVLRIFRQQSKGYYIDEDGKKMPLSPKFSARVLTAMGNVEERYGGTDSLLKQQTRDLYQLAFYISKDDFWSKQIEGIYVNTNGDFELIPLVGDQIIVFGDISRMEEKFRNLWLFYHKAMALVGWDTYKVINLKYSGQVVCEK